MRRTLIVGDVHGCLQELKDLLRKMEHSASDRLIFVGDLIARGPDSRGVLRYVSDLNAEVICGNWELKLREDVEKAGGVENLESEILEELEPDAEGWIRWIEEFPSYIEEEEFLVVHGGLIPGKHPSETAPRLLVNVRTWDGEGEDLDNPGDPAWYDLYTGDRLVVFGHWAQRGLVVRENVIGLDTGCVYGNQLSAVELPARRIHQVEARTVHCVPGG